MINFHLNHALANIFLYETREQNSVQFYWPNALLTFTCHQLILPIGSTWDHFLNYETEYPKIAEGK